MVEAHFLGWLLMGDILGYPPCCTYNFVLRGAALEEGTDIRDPEFGTTCYEDNGTTPTGYIMCPDCAKLPRQELIETINAHRHENFPRFPTSPTDEVLIATAEAVAGTRFVRGRIEGRARSAED